MVHIRFIESDPVSVDHAAIDFQPVAGHSDESLDQRRIDVRRIAEDDNVTVFRVFIRQQMLSEWPRWRIGQFVDNQVIANQ